jgi:hypothetical protein
VRKMLFYRCNEREGVHSGVPPRFANSLPWCVFAETCPDAAGSIVDQCDQLAGRAAVLQPAEGGTVLHNQLSEAGPALPPHMDALHALRARAPQALRHPLP